MANDWLEKYADECRNHNEAMEAISRIHFYGWAAIVASVCFSLIWVLMP